MESIDETVLACSAGLLCGRCQEYRSSLLLLQALLGLPLLCILDYIYCYSAPIVSVDSISSIRLLLAAL